MQKLNSSELESLKNNPEHVKSAKLIADQISEDSTVGGVFPKADDGNFEQIDLEIFKEKWCSWWPVARILLVVAKIFTGKRVDKIINQILKTGDEVCNDSDNNR